MNTNFNKTEYYKLKQELKETAKEIKTTRFQYKEAQRSHLYMVQAKLGWRLDDITKDYRHKHIALSEARGKTRDQIERPREGNEPNEGCIAAYLDRILTPEPQLNQEELCNA